MDPLNTLISLVGGRVLPGEDDGPARRMQFTILAVLASLGFAGIYGLAAGSTSAALAVGNLYKLPMLVLLSSLVALPAGLLAWKLLGARFRATDLLLGLAAGNLTATLVLAVLAPLVALYYHTSGAFGTTLAIGSGALALGVGVIVLVRGVLLRSRRSEQRSGLVATAVPLLVMITFHVAALSQLLVVASPILPEHTVFDGGVDAMVGS